MSINAPWFDSNRVELGKAIPLRSPLSITLTPSSLCNFHCYYCMQSLDKEEVRPKGFSFENMSWDTFILIINQMRLFEEKIKKLEFYGMGEPLFHPQLSEMLEYAKQKGICRFTSVMTNGSLLSHRLSDQLIYSGVDEIKISLQGLSAKKYEEVAGIHLDFDRFVEEIAYLYSIKGNTRLYVKIISPALTVDDIEYNTLEKTFGRICDRYSVENMLPLFGDVDYRKIDGNSCLSNSRYGGVVPPKRICHFPYYRLIILPDGRVTSCCDPLNSIFWGNIHQKSLTEIWNGPLHYEFLQAQLENRGLCHPLCESCYMPYDVYSEADKLEEYIDEAIIRFNLL